MVVQATIECPYCGEVFEISVDTSQGEFEMIEDCTVCCKPIAVSIECQPGEIFSIQTQRS
jgi:hypothetical protein